MTATIIKEEAIEQLINRLDSYMWTEKDRQEIEELRQQFLKTYNKERVDNMTKEDYFAVLGRKQGCMAYDLEWGTRILGSIKGGSKYKYGYETDLPKIKSLIQKVTSIDIKNAYQAYGAFSEDLKEVTKLSKGINGFKTGRTVIPKLLSIYYPDIFLPIFNDQDHFLSKLLSSDLDTENTGLDLYLEYNFKLLKVKEELDILLACATILKEENTRISDFIRILKYNDDIFVQEMSDKNEILLRKMNSLEEAESFVKERLDFYDRKWDGCGCSIDYYN